MLQISLQDRLLVDSISSMYNMLSPISFPFNGLREELDPKKVVPLLNNWRHEDRALRVEDGLIQIKHKALWWAVGIYIVTVWISLGSFTWVSLGQMVPLFASKLVFICNLDRESNYVFNGDAYSGVPRFHGFRWVNKKPFSTISVTNDCKYSVVTYELILVRLDGDIYFAWQNVSVARGISSFRCDKGFLHQQPLHFYLLCSFHLFRLCSEIFL